MNPKRKGFIWAACFFALTACVFSMVILGVSLYDIEAPLRQIAVPIVHNWQIILAEMIIWSVGVSIMLTYTVWAVIRARNKNKAAAIVIILCHCLAVGGGIYITLKLEQVYQTPNVSSKDLYNWTNDLIQKGKVKKQNPYFVPTWLDQIQRSSGKCCGILTFHDWEIFWAPILETYPKSCCLMEKSNCTTSVRDIIYPNLLGMNIKQNGGCYGEIVSKVKHIVLEGKKFSSILTVTLGVSLAAVSALYVVVFFLKKSPRYDEDDDEDSEDYDDGQPPKFPPDELTWRNLEFYRILIKRKKKYRAETNYVGGTLSIDPIFPQRSSDFQQPYNQQPPSLVEYRVDVLSASTVSSPPPPIQQQSFVQVPVVPLPPQQPPLQNLSTIDVGVVAGIAPGPEVTMDTEDDQEARNRLRLQKKGRHRHRHRPQDNDLDIPLN